MLPSKDLNTGIVTAPVVLPSGVSVPFSISESAQKALQKIIDEIPPEQHGDLKISVDLQGIAVTVGQKINDNISVSAGAKHDWDGDNEAAAQIRIKWEP